MATRYAGLTYRAGFSDQTTITMYCLPAKGEDVDTVVLSGVATHAINLLDKKGIKVWHDPEIATARDFPCGYATLIFDTKAEKNAAKEVLKDMRIRTSDVGLPGTANDVRNSLRQLLVKARLSSGKAL